MRRADRQVTVETAVDIIRNARVCRVGMVDGNMPYVVPLNFGYTWQDGQLTLYFHCAKVGRKIDILRQNNRVCFEMDGGHRLIKGDIACKYSFAYESVIGEGVMYTVEDEAQKSAALYHIMRHQTGDDDFSFSPPELGAVCVLKLQVENFTGKRANM